MEPIWSVVNRYKPNPNLCTGAYYGVLTLHRDKRNGLYTLGVAEELS